MGTKLCDLCTQVILSTHGNRKYHEQCTQELKLQRSKLKYASISMKADPFWRNEKILRDLYYKWGAEFEFEPAELNLMGFNFDLQFPQIIIEGKEVIVVRKFGFIIHKNQKIQIWKI